MYLTPTLKNEMYDTRRANKPVFQNTQRDVYLNRLKARHEARIILNNIKKLQKEREDHKK